MLNLICFESGVAVRDDLIQLLLPKFSVTYRNDLIVSDISDAEFSIYVKETFDVEVTWTVEIENIEDPKIAGILNHAIENVLTLEDFIRDLPEPLPDADMDAINARKIKLKSTRRSYIENNEDSPEALQQIALQYSERVKNFKKQLFTSAKTETIGILNKTAKTVGTFEDYIALRSFLKSDYNIVLTPQHHLKLLSIPVLATETEEEHNSYDGGENDPFTTENNVDSESTDSSNTENTEE